MQRLFLLVLTIAPFLLQAQDLTGVWQGHFRSENLAMRSTLYDDRYKFEVQIAQHTKTFDAVTYSYLSSIFYGKAAAAGTINVHTGKVLLQEGKLLELRNQSGDVCIMTCFLQYSKSGDDEFLEGSYISMNTRDSSNCGRGTVFLHKVASSDFYEEPFLVRREKELKEKPALVHSGAPVKRPATGGAATAGKPGLAHRPDSTHTTARATPHAIRHADSTRLAALRHHPDSTRLTASNPAPRHRPAPPAPATPPPPIARISVPRGTLQATSNDSMVSMNRRFPTVTPRVLLDRSTTLVRSLTVHTKEVVLNIYDDGAIDNDTISVYLDNRQVIDHAMLTDRPLIVTLHLDDNDDFHKLVLVADNEGTIPPNTSLMIVKAGDKEYKVNITSSLQMNASITFKYVKPD
jgi:hypothetical protein